MLGAMPDLRILEGREFRRRWRSLPWKERWRLRRLATEGDSDPRPEQAALLASYVRRQQRIMPFVLAFVTLVVLLTLFLRLGYVFFIPVALGVAVSAAMGSKAGMEKLKETEAKALATVEVARRDAGDVPPPAPLG
jgi:hypothetical protein